MIVNIIYLVTLLLFVYIVSSSAFNIKSSRIRRIDEMKNKISHQLNQYLLNLDSRFDVFTGSSKEWQEDFTKKTLQYDVELRRIDSTSVTGSSFDSLQNQLTDLQYKIDNLITSEKYFRNQRSTVSNYINELKVSLIHEPDPKVQEEVKLLEQTIDTDPIGAYQTMSAIQSVHAKKKKKSNA